MPVLKEEIKVSVIMPVYNAEAFVEEAAGSVLSQSLREIELICVDDCSDDRSLDILYEIAERDDRMKVIRAENRSYAGVARNIGMGSAKGEYLAFLDADDIMEPGCLEHQYDVAKKHDAEYIRSRGKFFDIDAEAAVEKKFVGFDISAEYFDRPLCIYDSPQVAAILANTQVVPWASLFKRSFIEENQIRFNNLFCVNDRSFQRHVLFKAKRCVLDPYDAVVYRINIDSSLVGVRAEHFECQFESLEIIRELAGEIPADIRRLFVKRELQGLNYWYKMFADNEDVEEKTIGFMESFEDDVCEGLKGEAWFQNLLIIKSRKGLRLLENKIVNNNHPKIITQKYKEKIIREQFLTRTGSELNIENPRTFNEKIQWLKLYCKNPLMTKCADKYAVREYVEKNIGKNYLIELVGKGIYTDTSELDFDALPDKFVLKTTDGWSTNIICTDKSKLDIDGAKKLLDMWLDKGNSHYYRHFEWAYKNIKTQIICEEFIEDAEDLRDYKFWCYNGKVELVHVCSERNTGEEKNDYFDRNWKHMNLIRKYPNSKKEIPAPKTLPEMIEISERLATGFSYVRVDLYEQEGEVKFGELSFYPANGFIPFEPNEWDYKLGELLILPKKSIALPFEANKRKPLQK